MYNRRMPTKDETIARVYDDFAGHGDLLDTYRKAKKLDPTITMKDVANWRERNLDKKKQLHGYNSFVASAPKEEYQLDMWFMRDNPDLDDYKLPALIMVDIFTKMTFAIAIDNKNSESVEKGVRQMMTWMKGTPETLYTDDEAAFSALNMRNYYEEHNIRHIITRTHAPVAERQIRTFKDMIFKRLDRTGSKDWRSEQFLYNIALVYNGMRQHRTTGITPLDAAKPQNEATVKNHLELHRVLKRKYPKLNVGDRVRIYTKKKEYAKERYGVWSEKTEVYRVIDKRRDHGQWFYYTDYRHEPFMRHELLKVAGE